MMYHIKNEKLSLGIENLKHLILSDGKRLVFVYKGGEGGASFAVPSVTHNSEASVVFQVLESDIDWAVNAYEKHKKTFATSNITQYLPYILVAFSFIVVLGIAVTLIKQFPIIAEAIIRSAEVAATRGAKVI